MKIQPTIVQQAVEYTQRKHPHDTIRQSIMLTMEYAPYIKQAVKESKKDKERGKYIDVRI